MEHQWDFLDRSILNLQHLLQTQAALELEVAWNEIPRLPYHEFDRINECVNVTIH